MRTALWLLSGWMFHLKRPVAARPVLGHEIDPVLGLPDAAGANSKNYLSMQC